MAASATGAPAAELGAELVDLAVQGLSVDAATTDEAGDVAAFGVGGAAGAHVLDGRDGRAASASIPGDGLSAQLTAVKALPRVCR